MALKDFLPLVGKELYELRGGPYDKLCLGFQDTCPVEILLDRHRYTLHTIFVDGNDTYLPFDEHWYTYEGKQPLSR
jgi:hypothetical protein